MEAIERGPPPVLARTDNAIDRVPIFLPINTKPDAPHRLKGVVTCGLQAPERLAAGDCLGADGG